MQKEKLATLGLLSIAIIWGMAFYFVDVALLNGWQTFTILAFRGIVSGLLLIPFAFMGKIWKNKRSLIHSIIAGLFFALGYTFQTIGQEKAGVIHTAFYTCLYVIFTPFIALMFGRKNIKIKNFIGALLALIGIFFLNFVAKGEPFKFTLADLYFILCAIFFALQIIWVSKYLIDDKYPLGNTSIMLLTMGIVSLICIPFANEAMPKSFAGFHGVLFATLLSSGLCSVLQFCCQKYVDEAKASIYLSFETVFACIFVWIIGIDNFEIFSLIGLFFIMSAVLVVELNFKKKIKLDKYKILLFDVDDTLLDFKLTEAKAFMQLLEFYDVSFKEEYYKLYKEENSRLWKEYELELISRNEIWNNRFIKLLNILNLELDPKEVSDKMLEFLSKNADILNNSDKDLERLSKKYDLYVISNGEPFVQYRRLKLSGIDKYFKGFFISSEIGHQKPKKEFFDYVKNNIDDFEIKQALVIGDSLTSDIKGAINYGIDACYFNPNKNTTDLEIKYDIESLKELK